MSTVSECLAAILGGMAAGAVLDAIECRIEQWWQSRKLRERFLRAHRASPIVYTGPDADTGGSARHHGTRMATRPDVRSLACA